MLSARSQLGVYCTTDAGQLHVGVLVHTKKIGGDLMEDMQFLASMDNLCATLSR